MGLGWYASKILHIKKESISKLLIYMIIPFIVFYGVYNIAFKAKYLLLPLMFFGVASLLSQLFLLIGKIIWKENSTKNLLALTVGTGNTGYFALPITLLLFGEKGFSIGVFLQMGLTLFENSIGFFSIARGKHNIKESLNKIIKLPILYSFILGIIASLLKINLSPFIDEMFVYFRGAYSLFGMMIIGMAISNITRQSFDIAYIGLALMGRVVIWPLIIAGFILLDKTYIHLFDREIYQVIVLMSIVPIGANSVAYATELKVYPEKAALATLISTCLALFYMPIIIFLFV